MNALWKPSNGWQSDDFQEEYCVRCRKDAGNACAILLRLYTGEPVPEWVTDWDGYPTCKGFEEAVP